MIDGRDLHWVCDQVGIGRETRLRRVLYLRLVERYTCAAIAAEMGTAVGTIYWHIHQGRKRIADHQWRCKLSQEIHEVITALQDLSTEDTDAVAEILTFTEEAKALLSSMKAPNLKAIMPALYDELGRRVGAPATVVTVDDVKAVLRNQARRRAFEKENPLPARPLTEDEKGRLVDTRYKG